MGFGADHEARLRKTLAACLAYLANRSAIASASSRSINEVVEHVPPSAKHLDVVLHTLDRAKPRGRAKLVGPLRKLAEHFGRRGIVVVISDFYAEPEEIFDASAPIVHRGNDVVLFHVLDPQEIDFSFTEASSFEDMESGDQMPIVPRKLAEDYRALVQAHIDTLTQEGGAAAGGLHAAQHQHAARLRAVPLPVDAPAAGEDEVTMSFLAPLFLPARGAGRPGADPPDAEGAQVGGRVPVADVPAQDSVRVGAAAPHSRLAAAGAALAAMALIVAAFARPVPARPKLAAAPGGARDIVVLLDRSYSMGYGDTWSRAQRRRAGARQRDAADRISLVLFADTAEVASRSTPDRSRAVAEINAAHARPGIDEIRAGAEARRAACSPNRCCRARK